MNNRYYGLRHGRSRANEAGIIVSDPSVGTVRWGLSDFGRNQVKEGVEKSSLDENTIIVSSDFLRTWETALLTAEVLGCEPPRKDIRLRERFFGNYEEKDNTHYKLVWAEDIKNGGNTLEGVESPEAVKNRFGSLIEELEQDYQDKDIILVSHGDALQIGQTWFEGKEARIHRSLDHLDTGEVRRLDRPKSP
ncbi:MAG: phosphoglycerate mutase family protein [Spirochaetales bacterium]|nr:phosphoglycerate mutase family protein [Spirochaetales bacterium]